MDIQTPTPHAILVVTGLHVHFGQWTVCIWAAASVTFWLLNGVYFLPVTTSSVQSKVNMMVVWYKYIIFPRLMSVRSVILMICWTWKTSLVTLFKLIPVVWWLPNVLKNDLIWKWLLSQLNLKLKKSIYLLENLRPWMLLYLLLRTLMTPSISSCVVWIQKILLPLLLRSHRSCQCPWGLHQFGCRLFGFTWKQLGQWIWILGKMTIYHGGLVHRWGDHGRHVVECQGLFQGVGWQSGWFIYWRSSVHVDW